MKLKAALIGIFLLVATLVFYGRVYAQDNFVGGQSGNLTLKNGDLTIISENLNIKLHLGFTEIEQDYVFANNHNTDQNPTFVFSFLTGDNPNGISNIHIFVDDKPVNLDSNQEFSANIATKKSTNIKVSYQQLNGSDIRGMRTFNYIFKDKIFKPITDLKINLVLMDGINLESFNKTVNPDLDLKLEPIGGQQNDKEISWHWQNFTPSFDIKANFYWPAADLARTDNLNQAIKLCQNNPDLNQANTTDITSVDAKSNNDVNQKTSDDNKMTKPAWQKFLINFWHNLVSIFKLIFTY